MNYVKLGEIAEFINGFAFKPTDWEDEGRKIIRIQNLTNPEKSFNRTSKLVSEKYIVRKGDLMISWSATLGIFEWEDQEEALLNQHIFKVVLNSNLVKKKYFMYVLKYTISKMLQYTHGSTMKHIVRSDFLRHEIPLPSLNEQDAIVVKLEKTDLLRNKRSNTMSLLDQYVKSTFLEIFGDPVNNTKKWEVVELGKLLHSMTSGSRGWAKFYADDGDVFLTIKNVGRNNRLLLNNVTHVNPPNNAEAKRTKVQKDDILLSITADLGRTAVVPNLETDAYINQHLAILRLKEGNDPVFVSHYLSTAGGQLQIQKMNKGAAKAGLNFNDIKSIKVPLPPISLQEKFTKILITSQLLKQRMDDQLQLLEMQFQSLMQKSFRN